MFPAIKLSIINFILKSAQYFHSWTSFFCNNFLKHAEQYMTNVYKVHACSKKTKNLNELQFWCTQCVLICTEY